MFFQLREVLRSKKGNLVQNKIQSQVKRNDLLPKIYHFFLFCFSIIVQDKVNVWYLEPGIDTCRSISQKKNHRFKSIGSVAEKWNKKKTEQRRTMGPKLLMHENKF